MNKITNEKIIETAEELLKNNSDVTLYDIGKELNITHAALYKHFKNKDELWTAVLIHWFDTEIFNKIEVHMEYKEPKLILKNWIWQFINAKKNVYNINKRMFILNTQYIDNRPIVLREVLESSYATINNIMGYEDNDYKTAEAIMSVFSVFIIPSFAETWNLPDYEERFENIWNLIAGGI
ncbi:TetR/AcrR family transcriptional regulator [Companilactobacillus allii]|uniref:TetR family transcriptional regulator n=1 Tax=Companilactobacillus allii TaxID=1847728 RepID=A0A1P8Q3B6_9LACO|nr:TetR/AcrR family transcriptional regulator [Companilactobacillus allii]APX72350.1 TetR family transcriptional regulator [Companilactobacillus allii]USQ69442.1 TetR/AcrR family transcriptional regulator [Companilactobacillus allii]